MDEGGGCLAWLLIIVTGVALVVYEGKRVVMAIAPYWPQIEFGGLVALGVSAGVAVLWLVAHVLWAATEPWRQRQQALRQIAQAQAEIRAIRERTAWQMARVVQRHRRR